MDIKPSFSRTVACLLIAGWAFSFVLGFPQDSQTNIPRSNRGSFQVQNSKLSTARGFGKRDGGMTLLELLPGNLYDDNLSRSTAVKPLLTEEIQKNPELIRMIVDKLIDLNGDGELTPDELQRRNSF